MTSEVVLTEDEEYVMERLGALVDRRVWIEENPDGTRWGLLYQGVALLSLPDRADLVDAARAMVFALDDSRDDATRSVTVLKRVRERLTGHRRTRPDNRLTDAERAVNDALDILEEGQP